MRSVGVYSCICLPQGQFYLLYGTIAKCTKESVTQFYLFMCVYVYAGGVMVPNIIHV